jgi:hypothetical protein
MALLWREAAYAFEHSFREINVELAQGVCFLAIAELHAFYKNQDINLGFFQCSGPIAPAGVHSVVVDAVFFACGLQRGACSI